MKSRTWTILSLVVTCTIAAFALAQVYVATRPKIEQQRKEALQAALSLVLPAAVRFEELETDVVWKGTDAQGGTVGIVFQATPQGYGGPIPVVVGFDTSGVIVGIGLGTELKETPGLGLRAREDWFLSQFRGKTGTQAALKNDGGTLDAISAATITSRAICKGVSEGIEHYRHYLDSGAPDQSDSSETKP